MINSVKIYKLGWLPDLPDFRDYTVVHTLIFPELKNQGNLGSCTANAAVGLVEYFERRVFGKYIDASRLFLYKVTHTLLGRGLG